jgi:hypothetical protein
VLHGLRCFACSDGQLINNQGSMQEQVELEKEWKSCEKF